MLRNATALLALAALPATPARAAEPLRFDATADVQTATGSYAPFYFAALRQGIPSVEPNSGYLSLALTKAPSRARRFDYSYGAEVVTSYNNTRAFWIQQLYAGVRWRALSLTAGSKAWEGVLVDNELSSGGLVWSGNARPIPQVRAGFYDFVDIPLTGGWLQIRGDVSYGRFLDDHWLQSNFNYQYDFVTTGARFHQKKLLFRTNPRKRLSVTVGVESAAQFGGHQRYYINGEKKWDIKEKVDISDYLSVLVPGKGGDNSNEGDKAYYYGNHLGAWHFAADLRLSRERRLRGYFEWLFDDGSGIGKLNGGDGLWGVELQGLTPWLRGIVVEYLQTTNQSGPIHWAPGDFPGTNITPEATGADNYYNNFFYNGWAHFGQANGSPMLKSPIYNGDGYLDFSDNRVRAFHLGAKGDIDAAWSYRLKASVRKGWGTPFAPLPRNSRAFASLVELTYAPLAHRSWRFTGRLGLDRGNSYALGNSFGASIQVNYTIGKL